MHHIVYAIVSNIYHLSAHICEEADVCSISLYKQEKDELVIY